MNIQKLTWIITILLFWLLNGCAAPYSRGYRQPEAILSSYQKDMKGIEEGLLKELKEIEQLIVPIRKAAKVATGADQRTLIQYSWALEETLAAIKKALVSVEEAHRALALAYQTGPTYGRTQVNENAAMAMGNARRAARYAQMVRGDAWRIGMTLTPAYKEALAESMARASRKAQSHSYGRGGDKGSVPSSITVSNYDPDYSGPQSIKYNGEMGLAFKGRFVPWTNLAQSGISWQEINYVAEASWGWATHRYVSADSHGNIIGVEVEKTAGLKSTIAGGIFLTLGIESAKQLYKDAREHMYNKQVTRVRRAIDSGYVKSLGQGPKRPPRKINRQTARYKLHHIYTAKIAEMVKNNEDGGQNGNKLRSDIAALEHEIKLADEYARHRGDSGNFKKPVNWGNEDKDEDGGGGGGGGGRLPLKKLDFDE